MMSPTGLNIAFIIIGAIVWLMFRSRKGHGPCSHYVKDPPRRIQVALAHSPATHA